MGGLEVLDLLMTRLEMFAYINVMCLGWISENEKMYKSGDIRFAEIASTLDQTAKILLFIEGGPENIVYNNGTDYEINQNTGRHTGHVWNHDSHNFEPKLYK